MTSSNKNGAYRGRTLIFLSTGVYGFKILIGNFSIKKEDMKL